MGAYPSSVGERWRKNLLDIVPLRAASAHLPPQPAHDPDAPGPFAFANPDRVHGILERAGFAQIEITAHDEQVGSGDLDSMLAVCSRVGTLGKILRENPELEPQRYRQCDPRLRPTPDLMASG